MCYLSLRINHQRPPTPSSRDHTIFCGKIVLRQPLDVPITHVGRLGQELGKIEVFGDGKFLGVDAGRPLFHHDLSVGRLKGACVG